MSDPHQADRTAGGGKPFAHRLSREALLQFKDAPAEAKLKWLEEALAFVNRFVSAEKRERWRRFEEKTEKEVKGKKRQA
jgi:hypothetical protein